MFEERFPHLFCVDHFDCFDQQAAQAGSGADCYLPLADGPPLLIVSSWPYKAISVLNIIITLKYKLTRAGMLEDAVEYKNDHQSLQSDETNSMVSLGKDNVRL